MNLEGQTSMKTSIKLALVAFGAAALGAMPLAAFADDATPEGGNNCSNMRTVANSRCVHYNEKRHDGWANQQAQKGATGNSGQGSKGTVVVTPDVNTPPIPYFGGGHNVNYADIISGKAARGGTAAGNGGSGGSRGGTSAK
jgi:hypothetical protein